MTRAAAALLVLLAAQTGLFIVSHSNTFDEPVVIGAGYSYVKTGRLELETSVHPPLFKYLLGLAVAPARPRLDLDSEAFRLGQPYRFGHEFIYRNTVSPETLLRLARLPSLLLSLLLGWALWAWARRWFGPAGALLALAAYALEPNVLAHGGLANMDLALTAFLFLAYAALVRFLEEPAPSRLRLAGVLAGCAAAVKLPGIFFFAWSGLLAWVRSGRLRAAVLLNLRLLAAAAAVVLLLYQVRFAPKLLGLLAQMVPAIFVHHPTEQHYNFLLGQTKIGGWPHYYLVALAVKTPLPFLALAGWGFLALTRVERRILAIPIVSYILICTVASKQNGVRYILPVFPFLCLSAGALARRWSADGRARAAALALLAWLAAESLRSAPNYLAYFNQLAGGPAGGYKVLVDSNLDWGQDFPRVRELLRRSGDPEIIVACLGNADRDYWLGPHQDLLAWSQGPAAGFEHANSSAPAKEWLIVSASFLQGFGLTDPQAFAWLRERAPLARPGWSTFVYDVTGDALSHFNVGKIYLRNGRHALARRQFARAAALAPERPEPRRALADLDRLSRTSPSAPPATRRRPGPRGRTGTSSAPAPPPAGAP